MKPEQITRMVAAAYIVAVLGAGLAAGITAPAGWVALTAMALLPAGALLTVWTQPVPLTSTSLVGARR